MKKTKKFDDIKDKEELKLRREVSKMKKEISKEINKRYHVATLDWDRFRELF